MHKAQRLINHVALVLDASYSMKGNERNLVKAADEQIKHLALRSEELSQETRVSVYYFGDTTIECLIFDMDVMRLPSIADLYKVLRENTALIDATMKSQQDLATTSQLYGDHAFLTFVLTDGQENRSKKYTARDLSKHIFGAPDNWSMGFLVPNSTGVAYMERLGVLRDSIAIWDTASAQGINQAASAIRNATDNFMTARTRGVRGSKSVFATVDVQRVDRRAVQDNLIPLSSRDYAEYEVTSKARINDFIRDKGLRFTTGIGYYQLTKEELVQPFKQVIVREKSTGKVYGGRQARQLIGLPDNESVKVRPTRNPEYDIFIQSTSPTRNLLPGTKLLVKS